MEYGCIGETLKHSFSKEIHKRLYEEEYELTELTPQEVKTFLEKRNFKAVNVTLPYKETVIPYLKEIDKHAETIGSVNTVVNRGGELYGYNTDFYGLSMLAMHAGIDFLDKKVMILGTGGTSKTAVAVANALGAAETVLVSRKKKQGYCSYEDAVKKHKDTNIIINATPMGMYPKILGSPIELNKFNSLEGVLDAVYNPICTRLILEARKMGAKAEGGLYMLVAQAVRAAEIFKDKTFPEGTIDKIYREILKEKMNIVLIGMPSSGKTTVGEILAEKLSREFFDNDREIEQRWEKTPAALINERGESAFRDIESTALLSAAPLNSAVISTGGGVVLRGDNISVLKENGRIYFIDRSPENLTPTEDRPLSQTKEDIERLYAERYGKYLEECDAKIDGNLTAEEVADAIIKEFSAF